LSWCDNCEGFKNHYEKSSEGNKIIEECLFCGNEKELWLFSLGTIDINELEESPDIKGFDYFS
jgi:hypothetical protein